MKRVRILRDTSGASIVIALVFFLICGIVGSVVMTAASVQAKAAQPHVDLQQKEYAMQSAAKLMAQQLGGSASNRLLIDPPSEAGGLAPVYGCITVDPDLNITVELSLDSAFAADSPYNTTISVQCTPTFDNQGRVTVIEYGDNTVVKKTEAA